MNVLWLPLWEPQLSTSPQPQDEYQLLVLSCALCRQGHATKASSLDFRFVFLFCNFCFLNPTPSKKKSILPLLPSWLMCHRAHLQPNLQTGQTVYPPEPLCVYSLSHFFLITLEG